MGNKRDVLQLAGHKNGGIASRILLERNEQIK